MRYNIKSLFFDWATSTEDRAKRIIVASLVFLCGYTAIIYKLQIIPSLNHEQSKSHFANPGDVRRDIVDRNGYLLASNLPMASLYANPKKIINKEEAVEKIASVYNSIDKKKLLYELNQDKTFLWICRDLTPEMQEKITNLGIAGLYFENELKRVYTQGNATSHILGYVGRDNIGLAGIEKFFDKDLTDQTINDPLQISIDYRLQNIVSAELDSVISKFSALGGVGIVADVTTGEILAMVSKPDFDPHKPGSANKEQMFNRASLGIYELGSTIKTLTFAIAFDTNKIGMNDVYDIGNFNIGKFRVKDYHKHEGWNTVPQLFMNSSNIGISMIALEVGKENLKEYFRKLGLTEPLPIEIPERGVPRYPSDKRWNELATVTMSYGYGFAISPLHFVQGIVPIVNKGIKHNLTFKKIEPTLEEKGEQVLAEETSANMLKLLRLGVEKGTGKKAAVKGYLIGGKTGTAEKLGPRGYLNNSRFSSFIAVAPTINPKYAVFIFLDDPKGIKETFGFATAGFTAAPVAGNILARIGALYGIEPYDEDDEQIKELMHVDYTIENDT